MRILFIDDDMPKLEAWLHALREAGHSIDAFTGPDDAIMFFDINRDNIDAAIVDIMLPTQGLGLKETDGGLLTGITLIDLLHKISNNLPIVAFSIRIDSEVTDALDKREIPLISKALDDPEDLLERLNDACNGMSNA